jgi:signal transduction histidine kinase
MAYVSRATTLIERVIVVGRRITAAPDWPLAAAGLLGLLAMIEAIQRADVSNAELSTSDLSTAMLLGLGTTTPVAFARTHDLPAAVTIIAATFLTLGSDHQPTLAGMVAQLAVLYLVGLRRSRRAAILILLPFVIYAIAPFGPAGNGIFFGVLLLSLAAAALALGGARRAGSEAVERDASRRAAADTLLEHAARGERARIARELHDVVAHHLSMIAVQTETARLTTPGMPTEMRRLLGVLRDDAGTETTRLPQPGLEQLNELVDEARDSAGASARLILHGQVESLDPGIELTAYRIAQEALTNARRHAPGAAVDVELHYTNSTLRIRVRDNGPGPPGSDALAAGHGLLGMRERATMVGGTLCTGSGPAGGFLVEAVLPTATATP